MQEWSRARDVLKDFDDRAHDLRKYGFSFVTALLAAQSLLIPSLVPGVSATGAVTDSVKLGVLLVTLLMLVTLRFFERTYELFRQAASTRARILELTLNLELTDEITSRYRSGHVPFLVAIVYVFYALGTGTIGFFIIPDYWFWILIATLVAIATLFLMMLLRLDYEKGVEDWTLDSLECRRGAT